MVLRDALTRILTLTLTLALALALALALTLNRFCDMNPDRRHNRCDVPQEPDDATGELPAFWQPMFTRFTSWLLGR